jgi:hypothetical protein
MSLHFMRAIMPSFYVNLADIVAVLVAGALLMVPVLGLTLRLTVPPIVESVARAKAGKPERQFAGGPVHRDALTQMAELSAVETRRSAARDVPALVR